MTEFLTPPKPTSVDKSAPQEELVRTLDGLLERYLHLLDQYQTLQQELTKHLSAVGNSTYYPLRMSHMTNCEFVSGLSLLRPSQFQFTQPHPLRPGLLRWTHASFAESVRLNDILRSARSLYVWRLIGCVGQLSLLPRVRLLSLR